MTRRRSRRASGRPRPLEPALVAYVVLAVVAVAQVGVGRASLDDVLVFGLPAVLLALAGWRPWPRSRGVQILAAAGAVLAVGAVTAFLAALPSASGPDGFYDVKVAVTTPVADHNVLASLLLVGLVAAALVRGAAGWGLVAVVTLGLGATLSRGAALVAVAAAVGAWLLLALDRHPTPRPTRNSTLPPQICGRSVELRGVAARLTVGAVGALGLVLAAAVVLGAAVPEGDGPTSVASRGQLWRAGVAAVAQEPVVGVGLDGFRDVAEAEGVADPRDHAHDLVLHAAATVGIPAAAVYLAIWVLLLRRGWRHPERRIGWLVLLGGGALFAHGLIEETAFRLPVELTVAALLAVGTRVAGVASRRRGQEGT